MVPQGKSNLTSERDKSYQPLLEFVLTTLQEDDWLWERLQPALRLASRLWRHCTEKDPYWRALLDPFNREAVEENRDFRYEEHQKAYPSRTFSTAGHSVDEDLCHPDAKWLASKVDGVAQTLDTLEKRLRFRIDSAYHDELADLYAQPGNNVAGTTGVEEQSNSDLQITIKMGADILYPLLFDGYSKSELFMSAFVFSATMMHELAVSCYHMTSYRTNDPSKTDGSGLTVFALR